MEYQYVEAVSLIVRHVLTTLLQMDVPHVRLVSHSNMQTQLLQANSLATLSVLNLHSDKTQHRIFVLTPVQLDLVRSILPELAQVVQSFPTALSVLIRMVLGHVLNVLLITSQILRKQNVINLVLLVQSLIIL